MSSSPSEILDTDIAIVGMSGSFPGAADVPALWANLRAGVEGITRFTADELRAAGVPEESIADPRYVRAGAVLDGIDLFDAEFFGYPPRQAQILDPQQRLFLEHCWRALEDSGHDPARFPGEAGVFGGCALSGYLLNNLLPDRRLVETVGDLALGLANDKDSLATRVAHALGLSGPSYTVQSYCSTSLVAVCAAATSLSSGECDLALAGGVAVSVPHRVGYRYEEAGMTSPDGRCRAFDAEAMGTPVGSGVAVIALRRLGDALADGDQVYAVIKGWAITNDAGHTPGFTAPGVRGQAAVVAEALASAGFTPADIDYVEAHGTGTALGDAAELAALQRVFRGERCVIGSVKTNVGHLDRAAGATGLIKTALALRNEELPATLNFRTPSPHLGDGLEVVAELRPWPRQDRPRRAGVSSFGIGGTNAHVVLEEAPLPSPKESTRRHHALLLSARSEIAADEAVANLRAHLDDAQDLGDVAFTLSTGRARFEHRRAILSSTVDEVLAGEGNVDDRPVGFLIAGVGEHFPGMAAGLYQTEPEFRRVVDECRAVLRELTGDDPVQELITPGERGGGELARLLGRTDTEASGMVHPALFTVEFGLARLLMSWGLEPKALAGYSLGEYVAACLAGVMTLRDALAVVVRRAELVSGLPAGAMLAVPLGEREAADRLSAGLDIAAVNGPELTVLAGPEDAIAELARLMTEEQLPCRKLDVGHAFHSRMLEPIRDEFVAWLRENVELRAPEIELMSNVTGRPMTAEQACDPEYWGEHLCSAVRFHDQIGGLLGHEDMALVEIGPGQSLGAMVRSHPDCPRSRWPLMIPTLPSAADRREDDAVLAEAVARLWLVGATLDWDAYYEGQHPRRVSLPTYPFQRQRYWVERSTVDKAADKAADKPVVEPVDDVELLAPSWRPESLTGERDLGQCVVFADSQGVADALGIDAVVVRRGEAFAKTADGFTIRPEEPEDYAKLVAALDKNVSVAHLWALDGGNEFLGLGRLAAALGGACDSATVIVATRRAQHVLDTDVPDPVQAMLAPLCVVTGQEYPNLVFRPVDLDGTSDAQNIVNELRGKASRLGVSYRDGQRRVPDYTAATGGTPPLEVRAGGTYLITGGLGEVGKLLAAHLTRRGAGRVVLTSRSGRRDETLGAQVEVVAADVTDVDRMREVVAGLDRLDGVLHLAAVTEPSTFRGLGELEPDLLAAQFAPKVDGTLALEQVLAQRSPDFCLLFSSMSAVLGGIGFAGYAAANAFLDAVAHRNPGWISVNWDTWSVTLDKLGDGVGAEMIANSMSEERALDAFDRVLAQPRPRLLATAGDLSARLESWVSTPAVTAVPIPSERFPRPAIAQAYVPPTGATETRLAELWQDMLGLDRVGVNDNFFDLGGTSMLGLQLLSLVRKEFGVAVPSVTLFEAPTVHTVAAFLGGGEEKPEEAPKAVVAAPSDAIAIVGMAGRFPGAANVDEFWANLTAGVESISFFSDEELLASGVDPSAFGAPNYVRARPVLADVRGFDAAFFGFSPRAAALTDPQQRIFMECCWEALEHGGYGSPEHRDRVGVFGGTNISTYLLGLHEQLRAEADDFNDYEMVIGNDKDALTTAVSYNFDLDGPSVAVQTFCSTSLVAVHMACQSLRRGECELALAGGVSVRVPDKVGHHYQPGGMESPDGHVRTFDADAHGSMFGDGAAVLLLKPLSAAQADGDHVWAVIRGSAMNNDGARKVGYTAPSVAGQARVVVDAMADAGVKASDVSYIEAHGTATELGDPIEIAALTRAFGDAAGKQYCAVGSVKTNVGHLDRAAGATGLIKTALSLWHGVLPPTLHYKAPNPEIDFAESPFYVNADLNPLPRRDRPHVAGVNSLGMGGTNVHVVVEQAPRLDVGDSTRRYQVLGLSARTATAADEASRRLKAYLGARPETPLADVAYTLQVGRATFEHRRAMITSSTLSTVDAVPVLERVDPVRRRPVAFLLGGVGEQYPGLVSELYEREPEFRATLDEAAAIVHELTGTDPLPLLTGGRSAAGSSLAAALGRASDADPRSADLARTEILQPAVFIAEYAIASTLMSWGVRPEIMLGYSLGEYVAACLSGVLSLRDALRLVSHRAKLISALPEGSMLAVGRAREELGELPSDVDLAAVNGPQLCVLAGPTDAIGRLRAELLKAEVPHRELETTHAFHSRMLAPVAEELTAWVAANITINPPRLPYLSNLTGEPVTAEQIADPGYWARHMCEPVLFAQGVHTLLTNPDIALAEVGPGQSLGALVRSHPDCPPERWSLVSATLPGAADPRPDDEVLTDALARLWLAGVPVDWVAYHGRKDARPGVRPSRRVPLPTYPFERQEHWIEAKAPQVDAGTALSALPRLAEEDWLHLPVWQQTPFASGALDPRAKWLVFTDEDPLAGSSMGTEDPVPALGGGQVVAVRPGGQFAVEDEGYRVRPGSPEDMVALFRELRDRDLLPDRVLHLWLMSSERDAIARGLNTLASLARASGEVGNAEWTLDVVVTGAHQVLGDEDVHPAVATVVGPCRVIPLEYAGVRVRLIDTDGAAGLLRELAAPPAEPVVALRRGKRWVRAFRGMPGEKVESTIRERGVYLITGGLGGVGLAMAERLAEDHRARLVLLGRTGLPPESDWDSVTDADVRRRIDGVRMLREHGAEVEIVVGDVASESAVERAVSVAYKRFGALNGVLHAAGLPGIGLIQLRHPDSFADVLAPKVAGTLALEKALHGKEVDFVALFSSITSVTGGGPGQIDYCAANAFLDAYAHNADRVVSIGWGEWTWNAWGHGLDGYDTELQQFFRAHRARFGIEFDQGWRSLLRALASGENHVIVSTQDFSAVTELSDQFTVDSVRPDQGTAIGKHARPDLATAYAAPNTPTEHAIAEIWAAALGLDRVGVLDSFFELGGNSLIGVDVIARIRGAVGVAELPPHVLYEAPTVRALAASVDGGPADSADETEERRKRAQRKRGAVRRGRTS
ncbi:SDR family NAD(P)-dependent oxidoreductase [Allokutzneria sp. A3M-2-11 16]|uniref:type I polyketide synthase n=1 Tax=Allokutzneria sp. A3M-2-11 16 TaxID=2962043 RepID=UPI0020B704CE|nr:type I polyketide synthase [Allokutzneria sp. A3M-2-11 16]MCP3803104.1 SDR family NAD(P)-dependent oxidoreductase [Allokutzneria sp. A3M-2-11 16]